MNFLACMALIDDVEDKKSVFMSSVTGISGTTTKIEITQVLKRVVILSYTKHMECNT